MATKNYFIKASFVDSDQPLCRVHTNGKVIVDLSLDEWDVIEHIKNQLFNRYAIINGFAVDFMIEIPNED